jgi:hypothetical protein
LAACRRAIYVIFSREALHALPFSVDEAYREELFSWERLFTDCLAEVARGAPSERSKASLAGAHAIPKKMPKGPSRS